MDGDSNDNDVDEDGTPGTKRRKFEGDKLADEKAKKDEEKAKKVKHYSV